MQAVGMVSVVVILEHDFPVPWESLLFDIHRSVGMSEIVILQDLGHFGQPRGQRFGIVVEIDEDETQPQFDLEVGQLDRAFVEIAGALHRRGTDQLAIERVSPVVIRT